MESFKLKLKKKLKIKANNFIMKKFLYVPLIIFFCVGQSCNNSIKPDELKLRPQVQKNLDAWHAVRMAFSTGEVAMLDSVLAEDYLDHTPRGDYHGIDSVKANVARMRATIKDLKMETIKELVDEEYGFFWMRFTGKRIDTSGTISGPFDFTAIEVVRFRNGKAVEHWEYTEIKEMLKMLQSRESGLADSAN